MKLRLSLCVFALSLVPLAAQNTGQNPAQIPNPQAVMPTPPAPNPSAHTALTGAVMEALSNDPTIGQYTITANVTDNGAVSLNGVVPTQGLADDAVQVAKSVPGVTSVTSQILVNRDPFAPAEPAAATAPASTPAGPTPNQEPQARLADALAAVPALARVSGVLYDRQIKLIGTVTNSKDEAMAAQIARKTLPGYPIVNSIWVDAHPLAPPPKVPR